MQQNEVLNWVLIVIGRSLLQYTPQAWPWTRNGATQLHKTLEQLISEQSDRVRQLAELLDSRRFTVEFGVFPDFTDLHFLSLEYLLPHLRDNERWVVEQVESAVQRAAGDPDGSALLARVLEGERATLAKLEEVTAPKD